MRYIKITLNLLVFSVLFIFFAQNYDILTIGIQLKIGFFFTEPYYFPPIPLYMLLLLIFLLAIVATFLLTLRDKLHMRSELKKAEKAIKEQEKELISLRNLPLQTSSSFSSLDELHSSSNTL